MFLTQFSCAKKFERDKELYQYLSKVHDLNLDKKKVIIILQTDFCGACTNNVISFLNEELEKLQIETIIIFSKNKKEITSQFDKENSNIKILFDKEFQIEKFGLQFTSDLFFLFENSYIQYWNFIEEEEFKSIQHKLIQLKE
jgi:peroxiredoxin